MRKFKLKKKRCRRCRVWIIFVAGYVERKRMWNSQTNKKDIYKKKIDLEVIGNNSVI